MAAKLAGATDLYNEVERIEPDVIIIDLESPDSDTLEQMREISRDRPKPVVMFAKEMAKRGDGAGCKNGSVTQTGLAIAESH